MQIRLQYIKFNPDHSRSCRFTYFFAAQMEDKVEGSSQSG